MKVAEAALRGGADVVQWRDKESTDREFLTVAWGLRRLTRRFQVPFVVNDRVAVALLVQADAVHLGHQDLSMEEARSLVGKRIRIGRSTHSLAEAVGAQAAGADYLGVGPVFATPTKPDYPAVGTRLLGQVQSRIRIPWFAIGGVDLKNLPEVLSAGASRVAVVRAVCGQGDPEGAARWLKDALEKGRS